MQKICLLEANTEPELRITTDEALEIYKQIQAELIPTSFSDYTDEQLSEILENEERLEKLNQETILNNFNKSLVCPVCQKSNIYEENNMLICNNISGCKLKIDTLRCLVNLNELDRRLEIALAQHDCSEVPFFQFKARDEDPVLFEQLIANKDASCFLLMSCEKCNFLEFII